MCTITLNINEAQVRKLNPSLTDKESITRWAQRVIDSFISDHQASNHPDEVYLDMTKEYYTPEETYELVMNDIRAIYDVRDTI